MFRTVEVTDFLAAWKTLRTGGSIPHFRELFQRLPNAVIPQLLVFECESGANGEARYTVRFVGTQFVGLLDRDITGLDLLSLVPPKLAAVWRRNTSTVIEHPCGMHSVSRLILSSRTDIEVESVLLPAGNDPGRPLRAVIFGQEFRVPLGLAEDAPHADREWIDIGSGVPLQRPR